MTEPPTTHDYCDVRPEERIRFMLRDAHQDLAAAKEQLEAARENAYEAIRQASASGMSLRAIADATRLSHQRIAQIVDMAVGSTHLRTRASVADDIAERT